jgi:hypothetical protein
MGLVAFLPASTVLEENHVNNKPTVTKYQPMGQEVHGRPPDPGPRPNTNPNMDSFEAVMQAMDAELARTRKPGKKQSSKPQAPAPTPDKGKGKEIIPVENKEDVEAAMDAELRAVLENDEDDEGEEGEGQMDYNLIKNFLESFKNQGGLSGPVSNLAGRLQTGWTLPRDET